MQLKQRDLNRLVRYVYVICNILHSAEQRAKLRVYTLYTFGEPGRERRDNSLFMYSHYWGTKMDKERTFSLCAAIEGSILPARIIR